MKRPGTPPLLASSSALLRAESSAKLGSTPSAWILATKLVPEGLPTGFGELATRYLMTDYSANRLLVVTRLNKRGDAADTYGGVGEVLLSRDEECREGSGGVLDGRRRSQQQRIRVKKAGRTFRTNSGSKFSPSTRLTCWTSTWSP